MQQQEQHKCTNLKERKPHNHDIQCGVAIGAGWQAVVAYVNIACYYLFGIPVGQILGYKVDLGVKGIWCGMMSGTILQTCVLLLMLYKTNWNKEVRNS
ncbi:Protein DETOXIFICATION 32 [Trifolium repens]|nr:Protein DETOXIFICATION 32 [Trifolium repens]